MPAISGPGTNEIKQHDMSVFWIKEETSNQHAGVYTASRPFSFSSCLHSPLLPTILPSMAGMTPSLSLYLPHSVHHWPVQAGIWDWDHRSLAWQRAPGRDGPVIWTLWWLPQKGAPPSLIGLAWVRFGLEAPYLPCMSIENTLNSLAACLGHARVSKTDRVWSGSKIGWGSTTCGPGCFLVASPVFTSPKEHCDEDFGSGNNRSRGVYWKSWSVWFMDLRQDIATVYYE